MRIKSWLSEAPHEALEKTIPEGMENFFFKNSPGS